MIHSDSIEIAPHLTVDQFKHLLSPKIQQGRFRYLKYAREWIVVVVRRLWHAFVTQQMPLTDAQLAEKLRQFSLKTTASGIELEVIAELFEKVCLRLDPTSPLMHSLLEATAVKGLFVTVDDTLPSIKATELKDYAVCHTHLQAFKGYTEKFSGGYIQHFCNDPALTAIDDRSTFVYRGQAHHMLAQVSVDLPRMSSVTINATPIQATCPQQFYKNCIEALDTNLDYAENLLQLATQATLARITSIFFTRFYQPELNQILPRNFTITIDDANSTPWARVRVEYYYGIRARQPKSPADAIVSYFKVGAHFSLHRATFKCHQYRDSSVMHFISPCLSTLAEASRYVPPA